MTATIATACLLLAIVAVEHPRPDDSTAPPFAQAHAPTAAPEHSLSFAALGDTGMGNANQHRVAAALSAVTRYESLDLVLLLGDNFYDDGVKTREDTLWNRAFEDVYRLPGLAVPFFAVLGNHDHHGSIDAQIGRTAIDERWRMPARYYTWTQSLDDEHQAQFVALDTETMAHRAPDPAQMAWLEQTLAASTATWKIAIGHHPLTLTGPDSHPNLAAVRDTLDRFGVDAYFCGHEHQLTYSRRPQGFTEVISGAGSNPRPLKGAQRADFAHQGLGFVCVRLTPKAMMLSFLDDHDTVLFVDTLLAHSANSKPAPMPAP
jgi:acid phosphatase